jgi:hypothetical protein
VRFVGLHSGIGARRAPSDAKIHRTEDCVIDLDRVMGTEAFDLNRIMEFDPTFR